MISKIRLKCAYNNQPPSEKELLVLSPNGVFHITMYRNNYNIFACQSKKESVEGWYWAELNYELND